MFPFILCSVLIMMLCPTESGAAEPDVPSDLRTLHTQYILPALMEEERRAVPSLAAFFSRIVNVRARARTVDLSLAIMAGI
eukprot:COSAG01_NODE_3499_length_6004_cov_2.645047_1_plen_80_part_10